MTMYIFIHGHFVERICSKDSFRRSAISKLIAFCSGSLLKMINSSASIGIFYDNYTSFYHIL